MTTYKSKTNILDCLDEQLNGYFSLHNDYPSSIIMSKTTYDKVYAELKEEGKADQGWIDLKYRNYKGIIIKIRDVEFIEMEK